MPPALLRLSNNQSLLSKRQKFWMEQFLYKKDLEKHNFCKKKFFLELFRIFIMQNLPRP